MKFRTALLMALLAAPWSVLAAPNIQVEALNYPVWVLRDGQKTPLSVGDEVLAGDRIETGNSGRIALLLVDTSVVKLGSQTHLTIQTPKTEPEADLALKIDQGNIKVSTAQNDSSAGYSLQVGDLGARLSPASTLIAKADAAEDIIVLLDGQITVQSEGSEDRLMNQPKSLYRKEKGQFADLPSQSSQQQVEQLIALNSISLLTPNGATSQADTGGPAQANSQAGNYSLVLMSLTNPQYLSQQLERFRTAGYAVQTQPAKVLGQSFERIVLPGFLSVEAARAAIQGIESELDLQGLWLLHQ